MKAIKIKSKTNCKTNLQPSPCSTLHSLQSPKLLKPSPTFSLNPRNSPSITLTIGLSILPTVPKSPPLSWIPPTRNPTGTSKLP